jgi:hypothetical protein
LELLAKVKIANGKEGKQLAVAGNVKKGSGHQDQAICALLLGEAMPYIWLWVGLGMG